MEWSPAEGGATIGSVGSEAGTILIDEEHVFGARITLEEGGSIAPFAITCGIYGCLVHTRFFTTRAEGEQELERMKRALARILESCPEKHDPERERKMQQFYDAISRFVEDFPT